MKKTQIGAATRVTGSHGLLLRLPTILHEKIPRGFRGHGHPAGPPAICSPRRPPPEATPITWAEQFPDRADDHFVFPSEHVGAGGGSFDANISSTEPSKAVGTLKTAWDTAKKAAKVKARWHDLRHTAVTRLLENGQTLPMVASIMGWSPSTTVRMAQRYGHISTDARRAAMEAMNQPKPAARFENEADAEEHGAIH